MHCTKQNFTEIVQTIHDKGWVNFMTNFYQNVGATTCEVWGAFCENLFRTNSFLQFFNIFKKVTNITKYSLDFLSTVLFFSHIYF